METEFERPARILLYSPDRRVRSVVLESLGDRLSLAGPTIEWHEVAQAEVVVDLMDSDKVGFDLLILDGEAGKVGGMGLARQLRDEIYNCPPMVVIIARAADAWLASWSLADEVVTQPIDPIELHRAVAPLVRARMAA